MVFGWRSFYQLQLRITFLKHQINVKTLIHTNTKYMYTFHVKPIFIPSALKRTKIVLV